MGFGLSFEIWAIDLSVWWKIVGLKENKGNVKGLFVGEAAFLGEFIFES